MARRRQPKTALSSGPAPNDGTPLGHLSVAELVKEIARRQTAKGVVDLDAMESFVEDLQQQMGQDALAATIAALPPEEPTPKPCSKCGRLCPVKARNRVRRILTVAGEVRLTRNYHHCGSCGLGFYPRDAELKLPESGQVSSAMERRILDFGVNDTYEAAAERWSIHSRIAISSNLVRLVVDRVGERQDSARTELLLQRSYRPTPEEIPKSLVIAVDGGMLLTRDGGWKEAKVAVVARGEDFLQSGSRTNVSQARYVAEFGQTEFREGLAAALEAERADEVRNAAWVGDGAPENWKTARELCPFAVQILDQPHAIGNGVTCGKQLLGEGDPGLPDWQARLTQLIDADSPDAAIRELMDCLEYATDDQLAAIDDLVRYYRNNAKRMRYTTFRKMGLPIGSGIVESAHRHVLQVRMKRAGQRWALTRARRMARLRAAYRTAGPRRFHAAISEALTPPPTRARHQPLPTGARRAKRSYSPHPGSSLNRAAARSKPRTK